MTVFPECLACRHLRRDRPDLACAAFPERIPTPLQLAGRDHRSAYPGDRGIRFEPAPATDPAREGR